MEIDDLHTLQALRLPSITPARYAVAVDLAYPGQMRWFSNESVVSEEEHNENVWHDNAPLVGE